MASSLRARKSDNATTNGHQSSDSDPSSSSRSPSSLSPPVTHFSPFDILRLALGVFLLSSTLSYLITGDSLIWKYPRPAYTRLPYLKAYLRGPISLSESELSLYNGTDPKLPIYLAVNGSIYDVSASPRFYGPGGSYHFFAGRDATRAFVTGCFEEDLVADLRGVEEMFVPVEEGEVNNGDGVGPGREKEETKEEKRKRKLRREREWRVARQNVRDTVRGWERMFDGGKGGRYFKIGKVKREEGGEESLGPVRELCAKAREGRPKRGKDGKAEDG